MKDLISRLKSPVVLVTIFGGLGLMFEAIEQLQPKTVLGILIIICSYLGSVFAALNNPTDKESF